MGTRSGRIGLVVFGIGLVAVCGALLLPPKAPVGAQEEAGTVGVDGVPAPSLMQPVDGAAIVLGPHVASAMLPVVCLEPLTPVSDPMSWPYFDIETGENTPAMEPELESGEP